MSNRKFCLSCQAIVPIASNYASKVVGASVVGAIGGKKKGLPGLILGSLAGLLAGHVVDNLGQEVCSRCGCSKLRSA